MNTTIYPTLGEKIKFFRKRAGKSQFELELDIDSSPGVMSRIENDKVNPSKETLNKITNVLNIKNIEMRYLTGDTTKPATKEEIDLAIEEVKHYFEDKRKLAYLVDDRQRIVWASRGWEKGLNIKEDFAIENIYGKPTLEITLDPSLKIRDHFSKSDFTRIVYNAMIRFEYLTGFMKGDPLYEYTVNIINKFPIAREQYEKAKQNMSVENLNSNEARTLSFKMLGISVEMKFSVEPLATSDRFSIYEYTPTNPLLRLLRRA